MILRFLSLSLLLLVAVLGFSQSDTRMEFFPATTNHYAGLNVYSITTGEFNQFYVENGQWVKNNFIPQPPLSISGGDYRMDFIPGGEGSFHGLFAYSRNSGQFEILYLDAEGWKTNPYFPGSVINFGEGDIVLDFTPAQNGEVAYLTAYSVDGKHFGIYYVNGGQWDKSEKFPQ